MADYTLAEVAYEAFREAEFGDDKDENLPPFRFLPEKEKQAWSAVGEAVRRIIIN